MDTPRPIWTPGQLTLDGGTDFNVVLQGMATNGGFAIDDITFSKGTCPSKEMGETTLKKKKSIFKF